MKNKIRCVKPTFSLFLCDTCDTCDTYDVFSLKYKETIGHEGDKCVSHLCHSCVIYVSNFLVSKL